MVESVSLLAGASQVIGWPHEALQLDLAFFVVFFLFGGKGSDFFVYYTVCSINCIFCQVICTLFEPLVQPGRNHTFYKSLMRP